MTSSSSILGSSGGVPEVGLKRLLARPNSVSTPHQSCLMTKCDGKLTSGSEKASEEYAEDIGAVEHPEGLAEFRLVRALREVDHVFHERLPLVLALKFALVALAPASTARTRAGHASRPSALSLLVGVGGEEP